MLQKTNPTTKKKSLIERFLLIITILVFVGYFFLGIMVIFWKKFPLDMTMTYRIALGILLIGYAIVRFFRFYNTNNQD
jgi:hypothetical protein